MTLAELIADHLTQPDYDSAEVVRAHAEKLAHAAGLQCRIDAVDLATTPPTAKVRIAFAVRVEPCVPPLAKTCGGPARRVQH